MFWETLDDHRIELLKYQLDILPRLKPWDSLDCSQDHLARRLGYSCGFQGFAL